MIGIKERFEKNSHFRVQIIVFFINPRLEIVQNQQNLLMLDFIENLLLEKIHFIAFRVFQTLAQQTRQRSENLLKVLILIAKKINNLLEKLSIFGVDFGFVGRFVKKLFNQRSFPVTGRQNNRAVSFFIAQKPQNLINLILAPVDFVSPVRQRNQLQLDAFPLRRNDLREPFFNSF